jgi:hypothetical protein
VDVAVNQAAFGCDILSYNRNTGQMHQMGLAVTDKGEMYVKKDGEEYIRVGGGGGSERYATVIWQHEHNGSPDITVSPNLTVMCIGPIDSLNVKNGLMPDGIHFTCDDFTMKVIEFCPSQSGYSFALTMDLFYISPTSPVQWEDIEAYSNYQMRIIGTVAEIHQKLF